LSDAISKSLSELGLPIHIPKDLPREELIRAMRLDKKKSGGVIRFALPAEIGNVDLIDVADLEMALEAS
jgi:3-dehydroquinate synthetase